MSFKLVSPFQPQGDQPQAIEQLVEGIERGDRDQVILGVTGSDAIRHLFGPMVAAKKKFEAS